MPTGFISSVLDVMFYNGLIGFIPYLIFLAAFVWICAVGIRSLIEHLRPGTTFSKGKPVIAYKVAMLTESGFAGVSGGGAYSYLSQGRLNPGFHGFKNLNDLESSPYASMGNVVLEVLLYGAVNEFESGYIGSHQRVLQVAPNHFRHGTKGYCSQCGKSGVDLYFDMEDLNRRWGYYGPDAASLYCGRCRKIESVRSMLTLRHSPNRFQSLQDLIEQGNERSTNSYPVGFVSKLRNLQPTVLEPQTSAR